MKQSIYNFFTDVMNIASKNPTYESSVLDLDVFNQSIGYKENNIIVCALLDFDDEPFVNNRLQLFIFNNELNEYEDIGLVFVFDEYGILVDFVGSPSCYIKNKSDFFNLTLEYDIPFSYEDILEIIDIMAISGVKTELRYSYGEEEPYGY